MVDLRCSSVVYDCILSEALRLLLNVDNVTYSLFIDQNQSTTDMEIVEHYADRNTSDLVVECQFERCQFPSSGGGTCETGMCSCGPTCSPLIKGIVEDTLSNKPAEMFEVSDSEISLVVEGAPLPLEGYGCRANNCILFPEYDIDNSTNITNIEIQTNTSGTNDDNPLSFSSKEAIFSVAILGVLFGLFFFLTCATYILVPSTDLCRKKQKETSAKSTPRQKQDNDNDRYSLNFHNISVDSVGSKGEPKVILNNISGSASSGEVLGVMGPSGSGKSTLLNVLAGSKQLQRQLKQTNGHLQLVTKTENQSLPATSTIIAHVLQDDFLYETLTVRESIEYSALLRLPKSMSLEDKQQQVNSILKELHLEHVADNRIGVPGNGISGGERKRVSIGMELVTVAATKNQNINKNYKDEKEKVVLLILDEPTSGLDSFGANNLLRVLSELASNPRKDRKCIVVLSIHQPSMRSFRIMDKILLLSGGNVTYHGKTSDVENYFDMHGFPCDADNTIADHILEVVSNIDGNESKLSNLVAAANFANQRMSSDRSDTFENPRNEKNVQQIPFFREITILYARTAKDIFRNQSLFILQFATSVFAALLVCGLYHNVTDDLAGFQNRTGAFYFTLTFFAFTSFSSMDTFFKERRIFVRESGYHYYRTVSYFLAKTTLDTLLLNVIPVTTYALILYWIMGLKSTLEAFLIFWASLVLFSVCAGMMTTCIGIATSTVGQANLVAAVWFLIMLLFGGFLVNIQTMPAAYSWIKYLSIFYYTFEILITNELTGVLLSFNAPGYPSIPTFGEVFLAALGTDVKYQFRNFLCLCALGAGFSLFAYILLILQVPKTRKPQSYNQKNFKVQSSNDNRMIKVNNRVESRRDSEEFKLDENSC